MKDGDGRLWHEDTDRIFGDLQQSFASPSRRRIRTGEDSAEKVREETHSFSGLVLLHRKKVSGEKR